MSVFGEVSLRGLTKTRRLCGHRWFLFLGCKTFKVKDVWLIL
jgi:hypothetical protein